MIKKKKKELISMGEVIDPILSCKRTIVIGNTLFRVWSKKLGGCSHHMSFHFPLFLCLKKSFFLRCWG
jgi:hypothetical protein